ncbi:notch domain-containing protein [Cyclospora cayetanensis]|uniref:Notch domain-containing protein n=1 Tax=Cyclospora cayetanensis TaxID=88456 RepID=A0A1D3CZN1_9EIME|nr:notch domain-containing protein [Cyclospora cayetanensis]
MDDSGLCILVVALTKHAAHSSHLRLVCPVPVFQLSLVTLLWLCMQRQQLGGDIGLLASDSSTETGPAQGVLDGQRDETSIRELNSMETPQLQAQEESEAASSEANKDRLPTVCSQVCKNEWRGDGWCDSACNSEACGFDDGDCNGWCSGDCKPSWNGDGFCDAACYVAACDWDGGDCEGWRSQGVPAVELQVLQQKQRQIRQNRLQLPKCKCERRLLVNGTCNSECNNPDCLFDGGECLEMCNAKCSKSWLGDGDCDRDCDTLECGYDKGDCTSSTNVRLNAFREANGSEGEVCNSTCRLWMVGNSVCDSQCNNTACRFDGGDCDNVTAVIELDYSAKPEVYQFCVKEWIGDGHCDPNCYNKPSNWDGGDCEGTPLEKEKEQKGIGPNFNS